MASVVSNALPRVSKVNQPEAGAVHRYQDELAGACVPRSGSPGSIVASKLKPLVEPEKPVNSKASAKLSLGGGPPIWVQFSTTVPNSEPRPLPGLKPSTAIMYSVPAVAVNVTRLVTVTSSASSLKATSASVAKVVPV